MLAVVRNEIAEIVVDDSSSRLRNFFRFILSESVIVEDVHLVDSHEV
jgi:hypothetical protein